LYLLPIIIEFLGYNPLQSNTTTLCERLKEYRILKGLSLRRLAKELGLDPGTLANWEKGVIKPK
jgi:DNA-binding XRE family transcriptional regulator